MKVPNKNTFFETVKRLVKAFGESTVVPGIVFEKRQRAVSERKIPVSNIDDAPHGDVVQIPRDMPRGRKVMRAGNGAMIEQALRREM